MAHVVAVEQEGVRPDGVQPLLDQVGDRRLPRAGETGEPDHARVVAHQLAARLGGDVDRLPVHVGGAAQREVQQAGADGGVGDAVDEDEAAHVAVVDVGIERDRPVGARSADADLVEVERLGREVLERVDVDLVLRWR